MPKLINLIIPRLKLSSAIKYTHHYHYKTFTTTPLFRPLAAAPRVRFQPVARLTTQTMPGKQQEPKQDAGKATTDNKNQQGGGGDNEKEEHEFLKARKHTGDPQPNMVGEDAAKEGAPPPIALLVIDVLNDLDFPDNEYIVSQSKPMAERILAVSKQCRELGVPVIYCNDNFGKWKSNLPEIYDRVTQKNAPGTPVAKMLKPDKEDYFVVKPKHSAFYGTALEGLLVFLGVKTLIIVGMAGNVCILFTANDAFMRDFATFVPSDCIASTSPEEHSASLLLMSRVLRSNTDPSTKLDLAKIVDLHIQKQKETCSCGHKQPQAEEEEKEEKGKKRKKAHGQDMG
ncbi:hypothetical protein HK104_010437, partial [Borealophlyctis nickersoniae]